MYEVERASFFLIDCLIIIIVIYDYGNMYPCRFSPRPYFYIFLYFARSKLGRAHPKKFLFIWPPKYM